MMVLSINSFASAAHSSHQLSSMDVRVVGGECDTNISTTFKQPPYGHISTQGRRRRWTLRRINSLRGGTSYDTDSKEDLKTWPKNIIFSKRKHFDHYMNKVDVDSLQGEEGPSATNPSILSTLIFITSQSINVATAATVISGYFGAWVATWMIRKMHKLLPTLTKNGVGSGESTINLLRGKYRLTTLASIGFLLLHTTGIQSNSIHSRISDSTFVAVLWIYSHIVNPILGGMVGCTHVALGITSTILSNPKLLFALDGLKDVRMKKLGQYLDDEEDEAYVKGREERVSRVPIVTSQPRNEVTSSVASIMGSASLLLVFPQYFLGLYLLGSALVSWFSGKQSEGKLYQWLSEGICASYGENGKLDCGFDTLNESINLRKVPKRLVALYWMIAVAKGTIAYILVGKR